MINRDTIQIKTRGAKTTIFLNAVVVLNNPTLSQLKNYCDKYVTDVTFL